MLVIAESFAQFMPYVFFIIVLGLVYDMVLSAFRGYFK